MIGIDELDKISTDEKANLFLNDIKQSSASPDAIISYEGCIGRRSEPAFLSHACQVSSSILIKCLAGVGRCCEFREAWDMEPLKLGST